MKNVVIGGSFVLPASVADALLETVVVTVKVTMAELEAVKAANPDRIVSDRFIVELLNVGARGRFDRVGWDVCGDRSGFTPWNGHVPEEFDVGRSSYRVDGDTFADAAASRELALRDGNVEIHAVAEL